jgi:hypothetical protein
LSGAAVGDALSPGAAAKQQGTGMQTESKAVAAPRGDSGWPAGGGTRKRIREPGECSPLQANMQSGAAVRHEALDRPAAKSQQRAMDRSPSKKRLQQEECKQPEGGRAREQERPEPRRQEGERRAGRQRRGRRRAGRKHRGLRLEQERRRREGNRPEVRRQEARGREQERPAPRRQEGEREEGSWPAAQRPEGRGLEGARPEARRPEGRGLRGTPWQEERPHEGRRLEGDRSEARRPQARQQEGRQLEHHSLEAGRQEGTRKLEERRPEGRRPEAQPQEARWEGGREPEGRLPDKRPVVRMQDQVGGAARWRREELARRLELVSQLDAQRFARSAGRHSGVSGKSEGDKRGGTASRHPSTIVGAGGGDWPPSKRGDREEHRSGGHHSGRSEAGVERRGGHGVERSRSASGADEKAPRERLSSRQRTSEDGKRLSAAQAAVREGSPGRHQKGKPSGSTKAAGQPPLREAAVAGGASKRPDQRSPAAAAAEEAAPQQQQERTHGAGGDMGAIVPPPSSGRDLPWPQQQGATKSAGTSKRSRHAAAAIAAAAAAVAESTAGQQLPSTTPPPASAAAPHVDAAEQQVEGSAAGHSKQHTQQQLAPASPAALEVHCSSHEQEPLLVAAAGTTSCVSASGGNDMRAGSVRVSGSDLGGSSGGGNDNGAGVGRGTEGHPASTPNGDHGGQQQQVLPHPAGMLPEGQPEVDVAMSAAPEPPTAAAVAAAPAAAPSPGGLGAGPFFGTPLPAAGPCLLPPGLGPPEDDAAATAERLRRFSQAERSKLHRLVCMKLKRAESTNTSLYLHDVSQQCKTASVATCGLHMYHANVGCATLLSSSRPIPASMLHAAAHALFGS